MKGTTTGQHAIMVRPLCRCLESSGRWLAGSYFDISRVKRGPAPQAAARLTRPCACRHRPGGAGAHAWPDGAGAERGGEHARAYAKAPWARSDAGAPAEPWRADTPPTESDTESGGAPHVGPGAWFGAQPAAAYNLPWPAGLPPAPQRKREREPHGGGAGGPYGAGMVPQGAHQNGAAAADGGGSVRVRVKKARR